jgi:hypothetical protein
VTFREFSIPGTWVNKPPGDALDASLGGIMYGVAPLRKRELARRREAPVKSEEEKNKELARRFFEA